jgi:hypothetical protein
VDEPFPPFAKQRLLQWQEFGILRAVSTTPLTDRMESALTRLDAERSGRVIDG